MLLAGGAAVLAKRHKVKGARHKSLISHFFTNTYLAKFSNRLRVHFIILYYFYLSLISAKPQPELVYFFTCIDTDLLYLEF
jgi:hypothetical protein